MAALREDYERSLSVKTASQKDLQENLISAKHELLRVQEQLSLAEKVRRCGVDQHLKLTRFSQLFCAVVFTCFMDVVYRSWTRSSSKLQPTAT